MADSNPPGPGDPAWKWFPGVQDSWSLDVVTLLAVIGESSMAEHSQAITASIICLFPRIVPAPQALLKPSRPSRMPETLAKMTGVYSGTTLDSVGFFANIITPLDSFPPFSFKVLEIKHKDLNELGNCHVPGPPKPSFHRRLFQRHLTLPRSKSKVEDTEMKTQKSRGQDIESGHVSGSLSPPGRSTTVQFSEGIKPLARRTTAKQKMQDVLVNGTLATKAKRPSVPAKLFSPIHILSVLSVMLSVAIIGCAIKWKDGCAILAITLLSFASSVSGYASLWHPILMNRKHTNQVPKGDVMIRTREGAFILIKCTEEVARELYSGTEECMYKVGERMYRLLMALGTILLMLSVILLGNCTWNAQVFIGASYIVLNGLYWGLGMLPRSYFWDLSRYEWEDVTPDDAKNAQLVSDQNDEREGHPSFTRTLWFAIRETKLTGWVGRSGAAPGTDQWKKWLAEAEQNAKAGIRNWTAVARKDVIMKESLRNGELVDTAAQHAPATEVNSPANAKAIWDKDGSF